MDDIELVRRLPAVAPASELERERIRSRLAMAMTQSTTRRRVPIGSVRLSRALLLATAALALVGAVSAVGAGIFEEWGGPGHNVDEAAIRVEIADAEGSIALPAGASYPDLFPYYAAPNFAEYMGVQQVQRYAMCSWSRYWLQSKANGDAAGLAAATTVIGEFPTWQNIADPRLADDSIREQIAGVVAAASTGDPEPIRVLVAGACP